MTKPSYLLAVLMSGCAITGFAQTAPSPVGIFEDHADIGAVLHPGSAVYDSAKKTYTLSGSGTDIWGTSDEFHFAWKKVSGDITITADMSILTPTGDPHRKAVLMIRRTLDKDSDYVDAAIHGDGLTAIQSRDQKGSTTREVISVATSPSRVSLVKRGNYTYMMIAGPGEPLRLLEGL